MKMHCVIEKEGVGLLHDYVLCDSKKRVSLLQMQMFCVTEKEGVSLGGGRERVLC